MKKTVLIIAAVSMFVLIVVSNLATQYNPARYHPISPIKDLEPIPQPSCPDKCELPCEGYVLPGSKVYSVNAEPIGDLKDMAFKCTVLKKVELHSQEFYLVRITESGFHHDSWLVKSSDVALIH